MTKPKIEKKPEPFGELHPRETLFLREDVGSATASNGRAYEVTTIFGDRAPCIESKTSGKWWTISWEKLIELAIAEGIDEP